MSVQTSEVSGFQAASVSAYSAAARVGGVVIALGYLSGLVPGPIVAVVGGLALVTYGRNLLLEPRAAAITGAALAVLGGALGIAALRWGALELDDIRGVQSVLGPTVLVGPTEAAVAAGVAAGGAAVALAVWCARPWPRGRIQLLWWLLEVVVGAFAVATAFLDPAESARFAGGVSGAAAQIARWAGIVGVVAAVSAGGAWVLHRLGDLWRAAAVATAGLAVVASAALVLSAI